MAVQLRNITTSGALLLALAAIGSALAQANDQRSASRDQGSVSKLPSCRSEIGNVLGQRSYSLPTIGEIHETEIGGTMLTAATVNVAEEGVRLLSPVSFEGRVFVDSYVATFPPGEYRHTEFAASMPAPNASFRYKGEKNDRQGIRRPDMMILFERNNIDAVEAMISSPMAIKAVPIDRSQYELLLCERMGTKAFRREILYSGGAKGTIQLQYREFANDYARPAFSQELSFDLAMGKEMGFRGARIRVESISNTGIRYTVLKPLD